MVGLLEGGSGSVLGSVDLLTAARSYTPGIGLSASSRALTDQFLSQSSSGVNSILSLAAGSSATIEGLQQKILALRASVPESKLAPSLRGQEVDTKA